MVTVVFISNILTLLLCLMGKYEYNDDITCHHCYCCASTMFLTLGVSYNKVCGQVRGYQYASPDAFEYRNNPNIDTPYVDGISITHGQDPYIHIWTYVGGWREDAVSLWENTNTMMIYV